MPIKYQTRAEIRTWIDDQLAGEDEVEIPALALKCARHFQRDATFTEQFLKDNMQPLIYEIARRQIGELRGRAAITLGDTVMSTEAMDRQAERLAQKWHGWFEHVDGRSVRFMEMSKADVRVAIEQRRTRAAGDTVVADLLTAIDAKLKDGQKVKDVFGTDEVERILQEVA